MSQKAHIKRRQLFVDRKVQGVLMARTLLYWAFCMITITTMMVCWRIMTGPVRDIYVHLDYLWFHHKPVVIASILLLPILLIDTLKISNRFAGPMVRLRRGLSELADGKTDVAPINFRRRDFWWDFAREFNRLLERVQQNQAVAHTSTNAMADSEPDEPSKSISDMVEWPTTVADTLLLSAQQQIAEELADGPQAKDEPRHEELAIAGSSTW